MKHLEKLKAKICTLEALKSKIAIWKKRNEKIAFTNGCFDILHRGHVEVLAKTASLGDRLIIGLNSDSSIRQLKGSGKPVIDENSRALLLSGLIFVDAIILFAEKTPLHLITQINPDILAKGGDYHIENIVGHSIVTKNGGLVMTIPLTKGFSTTKIIEKIKSSD